MGGVPGSLSSIVGNLGGVKNAINSQSPAQNPSTPQIRIDTKSRGLLDITRVIVSVQRAQANEGDEIMQQFWQLFLNLLESRKAGTDPMQLLQELASSIHVQPQMPMQPPTGVPGSAAQPQMPPSPGGGGGSPPVAPQQMGA